MPYPGFPLRAGVRRKAVGELQARLKTLGMDGLIPGGLEVDEDFGPDTELAVRTFQARSVDDKGRPLDVDGVVGPLTWAALFREAVKPTPIPAVGLLGKAIEIALSKVGVMEDPLGSNDGPEVRQFLASVGLGPGNAWCAAFVYWVFNHAAAELGVANPCPRTGGVIDMWAKAGQARLQRYSRSQASANPELIKPGQMFFLDHGGGLGHMGLIVGVEGVRLITVEGNTTNITGSREGIGVFRREGRRIGEINLGFCDPSRQI